MRMLWPEPSGEELDDAALERLYAFPEPRTRPWVAVNFVSSADGAATAGGSSRGLSDDADRTVFALGRDLADVILVGAGTATIEGYHGVKARELRTARRRRHGLAPTPPIAVVSGNCSIPPGSPLITDTTARTIVLTGEGAPAGRRKALADAGADVVVTGTDGIDLTAGIAALAERGLLRVCCEGGPHLFASLLRARLVDELRLTVSPLITAGDAPRITAGGALAEPAELTLDSVLHEDSALLLRYLPAGRQPHAEHDSNSPHTR